MEHYLEVGTAPPLGVQRPRLLEKGQLRASILSQWRYTC